MKKKTKEIVLNVKFIPEPDTFNREIYDEDTEKQKKDKIKFPFELKNDVEMIVETDKRIFVVPIPGGYVWNGADIVVFLWRIIGSRYNPEFRRASMAHDYLLQFKAYVYQEILKKQINVKEYRRLTSLIFRHIIKNQGTGTIKANVMSWCVDVFQMCGIREWGKCKKTIS